MTTVKRTPPELLLGTAMWGWTVAPEDCYSILDEFYQQGGRKVDTATNYPINKNAADFRKAEKILAEWCRVHEVGDLEIIMKIGSLNNMMTPDQNLSPSFLMICAAEYENLLGSNLSAIMVHWDNRQEKAAIHSSLATLKQRGEGKWQIGLSGIRYPEVYAEVLSDLQLTNLPVELKHNILYSDYERYAPLRKRASFIAYGISAGGLKLPQEGYSQRASLVARGGQPDQHQELIREIVKEIRLFAERFPERQLPVSMNQVGMLLAAYHPGLSGILLGPSRRVHVSSSFSWLHQLSEVDYTPLFDALQNLLKK